MATGVMDESPFAFRLRSFPESSGTSHCCTSTLSLNLAEKSPKLVPTVSQFAEGCPPFPQHAFSGSIQLLLFVPLDSGCALLRSEELLLFLMKFESVFQSLLALMAFVFLLKTLFILSLQIWILLSAASLSMFLIIACVAFRNHWMSLSVVNELLHNG